VLDQVCERLLAPLDVVEDDDQRPLCRGLLDGFAERPGQLLCGRRGLLLPEQRADRDRGGLVRRQQLELLEHLDHRPVRDPVAVGKAAAPDDRRGAALEELGDEARLPHACVPDDRQQLAPALGSHALPCGPQVGELAPTPHEQRLVPPLRRPVHAEEPVGGKRLGLAFQRERHDWIDVDRVADERERRRSEQHVARRRSLLQAGRDVDRISGCQPLFGAGHDLPGVHADTRLDAELWERRAHLRRRAHGPQRVVLVRDRHAEDGHHGVADELLDAAAVTLDDVLHALEVAREQPSECLRVGRLTQRRRASDVAEQDGHGLPLLPRRRRRGQCGAAVRAVREVALDLAPARPAGLHWERLRRGVGVDHEAVTPSSRSCRSLRLRRPILAARLLAGGSLVALVEVDL
jgi:hypothetical protein